MSSAFRRHSISEESNSAIKVYVIFVQIELGPIMTTSQTNRRERVGASYRPDRPRTPPVLVWETRIISQHATTSLLQHNIQARSTLRRCSIKRAWTLPKPHIHLSSLSKFTTSKKPHSKPNPSPNFARPRDQRPSSTRPTKRRPTSSGGFPAPSSPSKRAG